MDARRDHELVAVRRSDGAQRAVRVPLGFCTHHGLARLAGSRMELISVMYGRTFPFDDIASAMHEGRLVRTTWEGGDVQQEVVYDGAFEFPCEAADGAVYGLSGRSLVEVGGQTWSCSESAVMGEPVLCGDFLAVEMFAVTESLLLIFDRHALGQGPVGCVMLPGPAPMTLHGTFSPSYLPALTGGCDGLGGGG